jgi:hypothetical protein
MFRGLSAALTVARKSCGHPNKIASDVLLNFANASRRIIGKDEGGGMKDRKTPDCQISSFRLHPSSF